MVLARYIYQDNLEFIKVTMFISIYVCIKKPFKNITYYGLYLK